MRQGGNKLAPNMWYVRVRNEKGRPIGRPFYSYKCVKP